MRWEGLLYLKDKAKCKQIDFMNDLKRMINYIIIYVKYSKETSLFIRYEFFSCFLNVLKEKVLSTDNS